MAGCDTDLITARNERGNSFLTAQWQIMGHYSATQIL